MRDYEDRQWRSRYGRDQQDMDDTGRREGRRDYGGGFGRDDDYRTSSGTGGYRQDMSRDRDRDYGGRDYGDRDYGGGYGGSGSRDYGDRGASARDYGGRGYDDQRSGRDYGRGRGQHVDYAHGMMEDMRRYAHGDYDRDDRNRGQGGDRGYGEDRSYGYERDRSMGERGYGGGGYGGGSGYGSRDDRNRSSGDWGRGSNDWGSSSHRRSHERGWLERAGDEVASWFGDEDAERRRHMDEARSHRGRGPRGYARSDDRIREDINDRLTDDPYVDASDIDVTVSNGEATLSGHVESRSARRRAEDIAESISGVTHVQNNLRVQQSYGTNTGSTTGSSLNAGATGMAGMAGGTNRGMSGTGGVGMSGTGGVGMSGTGGTSTGTTSGAATAATQTGAKQTP